jgi:hypothetical protein
VLLKKAGLAPRTVEKRYTNMDHGKKVNAAQAEVLNKTAGAHRGADAPVPPPAE